MLEVGAIVNEISCDFAFHHVPDFTKLNLKSDFPMQFFSNKKSASYKFSFDDPQNL